MLNLFYPKDSIQLVFSGLYELTLTQAIYLAGNLIEARYHHLYHLARFFADLQDYGYLILKDDQSAKPSKTIAIFFDVPNDELVSKQLISASDESILVFAEHPYYQPAHWKHFASSVGTLIHSYDLPVSVNCNRSLRSLTSFAYRDLPDCTKTNEDSIDIKKSPSNNGVGYSASIFSSNLVSPVSSLYGFRRHLINASAMIFRSKFLHCGKGWVEPRTPRGFIRGLKKKYIALKNRLPAVSLDSYHGSPPTKLLLNSCRCTYAVENFLEPRGYTTEKPLEALSFGTIPVYVGCDDANWLSQFIPVCSPSTFQVLSSVSVYASKDLCDTRHLANDLRSDINSFLCSGEPSSLALLYSLLLDS